MLNIFFFFQKHYWGQNCFLLSLSNRFLISFQKYFFRLKVLLRITIKSTLNDNQIYLNLSEIKVYFNFKPKTKKHFPNQPNKVSSSKFTSLKCSIIQVSRYLLLTNIRITKLLILSLKHPVSLPTLCFFHPEIT